MSLNLNNQSPQFYIDGILQSNIAILSRAITLVESTNTTHQQLAQQIIEGVISKSVIRLGLVLLVYLVLAKVHLLKALVKQLLKITIN